MKKIEIFITLGPSTIKRSILKKISKKANLLRLNMSHLSIGQLKKNLIYLTKIVNKNKICIDTEGAQIRSKLFGKKKKFKINNLLKITSSKINGKFKLYPDYIFNKIKKNDILEIGFDGLVAKAIKFSKNLIYLKVLSPGYFENNKGIHIKNRKIILDYLTEKDLLAIKISKKMGIKNYALSFANKPIDIIKFKSIIGNGRSIFKIETKQAVQNINKLEKLSNDFLIDRGDLSKDVGITNIPIVQRYIFKSKKRNTKIAVATNFLESMIEKPYPTRAELNDIFNSLEIGATGLVLAAETAIGKYPLECLKLLQMIIKKFNQYKKK